MDAKHRLIVLVCCLTISVVPVAMAASDAVASMADILVDLNHYPSDAEKMQLKALRTKADTTQAEKAIATAIINMEHSLTSADKAQMKKIINDKSIPDQTRELAKILYQFNHKASSQDKRQLSAMTD